MDKYLICSLLMTFAHFHEILTELIFEILMQIHFLLNPFILEIVERGREGRVSEQS